MTSLAFTCVLVLLAHPVWSGDEKHPKVILVSMDGFRYDYLTKAKTPHFDSMIGSGVTMPYMNNTFVTLTFPCHYSMVTGLYEESHGIIANHMYDPEFNSTFTFTTKESQWWDGAEPIWVTARKAKLKTGVFFWPGSEAVIQHIRPNKWMAYNGSVPYEDRVQTLVQWMSRDDFDLGLLYFDEPDKSGHKLGPDNITHVIERMDNILGLLMDSLDKHGLKDVNVIVTSDHGMESVNTMTNLIDLLDYVNDTLLHSLVSGGPSAHIRPQPGKAEELVAALSGVQHMTVMLKEDIPEEKHFKNHRRVQSVFAMADVGWQIAVNAASRQRYPFLGDHGYDETLNTMKPIFVAKGPAFKSGKTVNPIRNVDIYPLICHLLDIEPAPNNGSLERAAQLLVHGLGNGSSKSLSFTMVLLLVILLATVENVM